MLLKNVVRFLALLLFVSSTQTVLNKWVIITLNIMDQHVATLIAETIEVNLWITLKTAAVLFKFSALLQKSIQKSNMKDERPYRNWMCVLLAVAGQSFLTHLLSAWKGIGKLKTFLLDSINKSTQWVIASTNWLDVYLLVWFTVCICVCLTFEPKKSS